MESYTSKPKPTSPGARNRAKADLPEARPAEPSTATPAAKPETPRPGEQTIDPEQEAQPPEQEQEQQTPESEQKPGDEPKGLDSKGGKVSPWKLVNHYKTDNAKLHAEIAQLRAATTKPGELPKEATERFTALEARNKALEDEIRHVNYSKSQEFIDKYQTPYEQAWGKAISELRELTVADQDGNARSATVQDLVALANMPLGAALTTAKAWFGDAATEILAHRRTLRELSDKQAGALEEAKKTAGTRETEMREQQNRQMSVMREETAKLWNQFNDEAVKQYEFLRPVEGQPERNAKLEQASKFVDETLALNPGASKTPEQRAEAIKRHTAVRNRAIGYSVIKHENTTLKSQVAELQKALEAYKGSEPTAGQPHSKPGNGAAVTGDYMDQILGKMSKYAK